MTDIHFNEFKICKSEHKYVYTFYHSIIVHVVRNIKKFHFYKADIDIGFKN